MLPEKIKDFYNTRAEYFKKKEEIAQAMCELDLLLMSANQDLKETIDNGLEDDYLAKVSKAYSKHKFNAKIVVDFIEKIDNMFFKDLEPELKKSLEVVSLKINVDNNFGDSSKTISEPISISMHEHSSNRFFTLVVPIKSSISTDMIHWKDRGDGMYIVHANAIGANKTKEICRVFDQAKVVEAVRKYLKGEFDDDLSCETFIFKDKHYAAYNSYVVPIASRSSRYSSSYSYDDSYDGHKFIELHDLLNLDYYDSSDYVKYDYVAPNRICDIAEYDINRIDSDEE